jgi:energy-coupling factor transporter ATP-binding protein EcfA2
MARLAAAHLADELESSRAAAEALSSARGRLDFDRVGIAASSGDAFGLAETSFHLEPGQCLVALGPAGSGSALVELLMSRRRPESGKMRINGQLRTVGDAIDGGPSGTGPRIEHVRGAPWLRPAGAVNGPAGSPTLLPRARSARPPADLTAPLVPVERAVPAQRPADLTAPLVPVKRATPVQDPADLTAPLVPVKRTAPARPPADLTAPLVPVKRTAPAEPAGSVPAGPAATPATSVPAAPPSASVPAAPAGPPAAPAGTPPAQEAPAEGLSERERRDLDQLITKWAAADVLVLEEPTAGMERRQRNEVIAVLSQLTCTTVIVTADPVVAALGDHLVELAPLSPLRPRATATRTSRFRSGGVLR